MDANEFFKEVKTSTDMMNYLCNHVNELSLQDQITMMEVYVKAANELKPLFYKIVEGTGVTLEIENMKRFLL